MPIYEKNIECLDRESLEALQSERLVKQVKRMYERVEVFRKRMDDLNLKPEDVHSIKDLHKLPFSNKQDLRDNYPYGLFAEPLENVVRIHASSGTTGKQIVVGYTKNDLDMWSTCVARALTSYGATKNDIVQVSYGYGLFTGGLGAHDGATKLGCTVIPASTGNTVRQMNTMVDFGSTVLCSTPSYCMYLAEELEASNLKNSLKLKRAVLGAEPWGEEMRKQIESKLSIKAYDIYGLSEILGPGVSYECECQHGLHINEDMFIAEIIDPITLEVLPDGEVGELVFSTITKEAFPVLRYRTHDLCRILTGTCKCGRTFKRMGRIEGRTDDMLIIRGVNVFPSQIEEVLLKYGQGITPNYQIIVDRVNNTDTLEVKVEMNENLFADDVKSIEKISSKIRDSLRSVLGLSALVTLVNPKTIERSEGKAKRVIDKRKIK
ncbi:phenylacetate--CoA ligase [bacterium]|nr:phenylacetate--CoA ligase [bacterium]